MMFLAAQLAVGHLARGNVMSPFMSVLNFIRKSPALDDA